MSEMQRSSRPQRWLLLPAMFCSIFLTTFFIFCYYPQPSMVTYNSSPQILLLQSQLSHLQAKLGVLLHQLHTQTPHPPTFSHQLVDIAVSLDKFAESLSGLYGKAPLVSHQVNNIDEDLSEPEESESEQGMTAFRSDELQNYTSPKPNRLKKKNFLGVEAVNPSIGLACARMPSMVDRYMSYRPYSTCPDDQAVAQKLIANGCDPLPRRRCFSRTPPRYSKPFAMNSSLWTQPRDANILWNQYKCKDYNCLVSMDARERGFYKCSDCFNLTRRGWEDESASPEFTIDQVLGLKPAEIRIGLDFSPTTGTFAAIMRDKNVTVASATLNLGAPYNEVIALRGLLPLYISVGSRLPFFDNTLDIIHSTLFLDGWIGMELLQFVLFDWDRVLRPKGIIWIDRFFSRKEDMELYLKEFSRLGYKKLLWRVVPKMDKLGDELFFSAVLEKP